MKVVEITPKKLSGRIEIPPSKSYTHRAIICAALADGISIIKNVMLSDDVMATVKAVQAFGAQIDFIPSDKPDFFTLKIKGSYPLKVKNRIINCRESASTLRFLIPLALTTNSQVAFTAGSRLSERPLDDYYKIMDAKNILYENNAGKLPLILEGLLTGGVYRADTQITSQTISALLMALPLLKEDSKIKTVGALSSKNYIIMTMDMLKKAGIEVKFDNAKREFCIKGGQCYIPIDYTVEADYSSASFWLCASAMGCEILSSGLDIKSKQADKAFLKHMCNAGAKIIKKGDGIIIRADEPLKSAKLDVDLTPDLLPVLAVFACHVNGITQISGLKRLKYKESDRVKSTVNMISSLGGDIVEMSDSIIIKGNGYLNGGLVNTADDHRIAMAAAIASVICKNNVTITYADCVGKSYPLFWDDFKKAGGKIEEYYMGM